VLTARAETICVAYERKRNPAWKCLGTQLGSVLVHVRNMKTCALQLSWNRIFSEFRSRGFGRCPSREGGGTVCVFAIARIYFLTYIHTLLTILKLKLRPLYLARLGRHTYICHELIRSSGLDISHTGEQNPRTHIHGDRWYTLQQHICTIVGQIIRSSNHHQIIRSSHHQIIRSSASDQE